MLHSNDSFVKAKDRDTSWHDLAFMKDIYYQGNFNEKAKTQPLRFMVFETYIIGGIGTYVVGEVLSGVIRPETILLSTPGDLKCEVSN